MAPANVPFIGGHPADIIRILLHQVGIQVVQGPAHLIGVFLIHAEDDGLGKAVGLLEEVGEVPGDGLGAGPQGDDALEILGVIFLIGDLPAIAVQFSLASGRQPAASTVVTTRCTR